MSGATILLATLCTFTIIQCSPDFTRQRRYGHTTDVNGNWVEYHPFQFNNTKLVQDQYAHFMCGGVLSDVMAIVCNHCYSKKRKRSKRGIVDDCCFAPCTFARMRDYCGNPEDC